MALESGTYINSLNSSNPVATDPLSQTDEHLRLLKSTIKATFPNLTGAVSSTQAELDTKAAITTDGSTPSLATGITGEEVKSLLGVAEPAISTDGSTPSLASGITAEEVKTLLSISLLDAYPVGSVYISVLSTNPSTLFGGTWVPIGQGKVLVGIDSQDTDFDTLEETGGAKTHTLTTDEMPAHTHDLEYSDQTNMEIFGSSERTISEIDGTNLTRATTSTGGGNAHNNLQPYLVVSMWKRTV